MDKGKLESSGCIGGGNDHYMAIMDEKDTPFDSADDLIRFYAKPLNGWTPAMLTNGWYNHMRPILDMLEQGGVDFGRTGRRPLSSHPGLRSARHMVVSHRQRHDHQARHGRIVRAAA